MNIFTKFRNWLRCVGFCNPPLNCPFCLDCCKPSKYLESHPLCVACLRQGRFAKTTTVWPMTDGTKEARCDEHQGRIL